MECLQLERSLLLLCAACQPAESCRCTRHALGLGSQHSRCVAGLRAQSADVSVIYGELRFAALHCTDSWLRVNAHVTNLLGCGRGRRELIGPAAASRMQPRCIDELPDADAQVVARLSS